LDETVSRRHAQFWLAADTWLMSDLGSRHGTSLNGVRLPAEQALPIKENDLIGLGPWTFVVRTGHRHTTTGFLTTQDDVVAATRRVQRVPQAELTIKAEAKLDLIAESAATIAAAMDEAGSRRRRSTPHRRERASLAWLSCGTSTAMTLT
jgi:pSer/pThr/pTyr-binding forkhead associated (FHA) protein